MQRAHLVSFGLGLALVLAPSVSAATAQIQLTVPGQSANGQVNDSDPVAVSGTLLLGLSNSVLVSGYASSAADLTAGTVRVRSVGYTKIAEGGYPAASATVADKVTFHGPGPTVQVRFDMTAEGLFSSGGTGIGALQQVAAVSLSAGGGFETTAQFERDLSSDTPPVESFMTTIKTPAPDAGFVVTHPTTGIASAALHIDAAFAVGVPVLVTATATAEIGALPAPKDVSIDTNFGNTARLTMTLPAGYTFTSESGAFLTQPGAPGLGLPPDGGTGTHGAPGFTGGDASASGTSGASPTGPGAGAGADDAGGANGANGAAASSDSGCNAAGSASTASALLLALAVLSMVHVRRRHRSRAGR